MDNKSYLPFQVATGAEQTHDSVSAHTVLTSYLSSAHFPFRTPSVGIDGVFVDGRDRTSKICCADFTCFILVIFI